MPNVTGTFLSRMWSAETCLTETHPKYSLVFNYSEPDSQNFLNAFIADEIWNT